MILISILTFIKSLLFILFTDIEHNMWMVYIASTSFSLFVMTWIYTSNKKNKKFFVGLYYSIISLILFADVLYYAHFQTLPSVSMLMQIKLLPNVSSSVINIVGFKELLFLLDLPLVFLFLKYKALNIEEISSKKMRRVIPVSFLLIFLLTFSYSQMRGLSNSLKYQEPYSYHLQDLIARLWKDKRVKASGYEVKEEDILEYKKRAEYKEGNVTGIGKGKNLIVLQVEALQNFVIGLNYNDQEITPNLNKLINDKSSIYYDKYFQMTARGNTSDAEFVSNNSLYPATDAPSYSKYENNTFHGLPWVMRENGYTSLAFHGYEKDFWNRNNAYKNQGFQKFYSQEDFQFEEKILLGIKDEEFFEQSVVKLKKYKEKNNKPFYAFMVSLSSHDPFEIPEEYRMIELSDIHEGTKIGNYLQAIHYFDYSLGILMEELKEAGIYEDSVIAIYGDHFAIQENEETDVLMSNLIGNEYGPEDVMNIPLLIHVPGEELGYTNSKIGSQLDFFPTILNIMGYENDKGIVFGRDLNNFQGINFVAPQTIMNEGSFLTEEIIFKVPKTRNFDESMVFDIRNGRSKNINNYKELYNYISSEVIRSDYILKTDILKDILEHQ
ncbi:MAG: LTA synthase family protein [Tissierellia bacterium]|nr:LTA synthase family protein [Tissierellia bacterium]